VTVVDDRNALSKSVKARRIELLPHTQVPEERKSRRHDRKIERMNAPSTAAPVITVSELNRRSRELIEQGSALTWIAGEISNHQRAPSGHCYFSLKDAHAQVRCVFFRQKAALLDFVLANGMQVEVRALPTLYEARGEFQLTVETVRRAGSGLLFEAFERLKKKLEQQGLFTLERKRPIPVFPTAIGVVTSPAAAAFHDVLTMLRRRMPSIPVMLYPAPVQGEGAAFRIAQAIRAASRRGEIDVLLVCRGGGSMEDLWSYNEEVVARAIAECAVPVVTGIGHETDFTIADFVADLRAPTPTAAAASVSPDRGELRTRIAHLRRRLNANFVRNLEQRMQRVDYLDRRLLHPGERLAQRAGHLGHLQARLGGVLRHRIDICGHKLEAFQRRLEAGRPDVHALEAARIRLAGKLDAALATFFSLKARRVDVLSNNLVHLSPQAVLERGYSIVTQEQDGIGRDAATLAAGDRLAIRFARGKASARVDSASGEDRE
jgi:exodeoxyribonuclease VII large subunit